jgi:hypothetical protein
MCWAEMQNAADIKCTSLLEYPACLKTAEPYAIANCGSGNCCRMSCITGERCRHTRHSATLCGRLAAPKSVFFAKIAMSCYVVRRGSEIFFQKMLRRFLSPVSVGFVSAPGASCTFAILRLLSLIYLFTCLDLESWVDNQRGFMEFFWLSLAGSLCLLRFCQLVVPDLILLLCHLQCRLQYRHQLSEACSYQVD